MILIDLFGHKKDTRSDSFNELLQLIKMSNDNKKKIKYIYLTKYLYFEFIEYIVHKKGHDYIFGYELKTNPDMGVIWEKENKV